MYFFVLFSPGSFICCLREYSGGIGGHDGGVFIVDIFCSSSHYKGGRGLGFVYLCSGGALILVFIVRW